MKQQIIENSDIHTLQSRAITILRFPLAVMIVAIHCYYFNTQHINQDTAGVWAFIVKWIINFCSIILTDCAVPLFFVISGYLYFFKKSSYSVGEYLTKTKGKCITLLLPYLTWNILAVITNPSAFLASSWGEQILGFWSRNMTIGGWDGPWDGPLWFLRDLFVVMLFSPIISYLIRKIGLLLPILLLIPILSHNSWIFPGFSFTAFCWFSLGSYLAIRQRKSFINSLILQQYMLGGAIALFVIMLCIRTLIMANIIEVFTTPLNMLWIISSMTMYYLLAVRIGIKTKRIDMWKRLGASSFIIYAMHSLIIGWISGGFLFIIGKPNVGNFLTLLIYFSTISIAVAVCYAFNRIISYNMAVATCFGANRNR